MKLQQYRDWLTMTPTQKVKGEMILWEIKFKKQHKRIPTPDEYKQTEAELIAELPTPEEYQMQLFGEVVFKGKVMDLFDEQK